MKFGTSWGVALLVLSGVPAAAGVEDLDGRAFDPFNDGRAPARVLLFTATDCPISNRYAPEVQRLHGLFAARGVRFYLVYADPDTTAEAITQHRREYGYEIPAVRDPEHLLVKRSGAEITPEAAVFDEAGQLVYHGRIDDWYVAFGKKRARPTTHDLQSALEATLAGRPVERTFARAVGCYIAPLD